MSCDNLLAPQIRNQSLTALSTRSFSWTATSAIVTTGLWFVINIVLARLLAPDAFGLVGLSAVFVNFANIINQLGLTAAIIQQKELEEVQLSTAFWTNLAAGLFLAALLIATSGMIADFYHRPELAPVMIVVSLSFLFSSLGNIHRTILTRNLKFKSLAIIDIAALLVSAVASIGLALAGGGVYSLAIQEVVRSAVRAILAWASLRWVPSLSFSWTSFYPLFSFSTTVLISNVLNYFVASVDQFLIGKFVGVAEVGYYNLSYNLVRLPQAKVAPLINRVSYPVLSRVQDDRSRLRRGYLKTIQYISLLSFPALLGLFLVAPEFIHVVYGPQWEPSILPLQLLCVAGLVYSFATTVGSFLFPCGRPDLVLQGNVFRVFLLGGSVVIGVHWGVIGVAAAVSIYTVVLLLPLYLWFLWKAGEMPPIAILEALKPAFASSLIMMAGVYVLKQFVLRSFDLGHLSVLVVATAFGGTCYFVALCIIKWSLVVEVSRLVADLIHTRVLSDHSLPG